MSEKAPTTVPIILRETMADETVVTPHFLDASVIEQAQPAVPLSEIGRKRSWPTPIIVMALLFGLAVGAFGSMLFMRQRSNSKHAPPPAQTSAEARNMKTPEQAASSQVVSTEAAPLEAKQQSERVAAQQRATDVVREDRLARSEMGEPGPPEVEIAPRNEDAAALRGALNEWVAATNARDINKQMSFYNPTVNAFYRSRNASREAVRAEKARVFERANSIDIRAADPNIRVSPDGNTATMRFRKSYAIEGGGQDRRGAVVQELRWKRVGGQWRIVSERDLKVLQ
jgi:ketosteroid isomerase-like protein